MGTRSLTIMCDNEQEIAVLYRQYDGYPSGHGAELAEFLAGYKIVNGLNGDKKAKIANGANCLAAQIVAFFKVEAGGFYLHPAGTRGLWEDYRYTVTAKVGEAPTISIEEMDGNDTAKPLFTGTASELLEWLNKEDDGTDE